MADTPEGAIPVPDWYFSIPDDADEATKLYMRAQLVIQGAFYTFGDPELKEGTQTLSRDELEKVLCAALAMVMSTDEGLKTKRDIRLAVEHHEKYIRVFLEMLRESGDINPKALLDMLNLERSTPN